MHIAIDARPINHHVRHGIFTYTEELIYRLTEIDPVNTYYFLFCSLKKTAEQLPGPEGEHVKRVVLPVPDCDFFLKSSYLSRIALPRFLKKNACNVFHSTFATLTLNMKVCKYVLTVHDLKSLYVKNDEWNQYLPGYIKALKCANAVIAVSQSTKNDLVRHFRIPEAKVKVVYEGADEQFRKLDNKVVDGVRNKYGLSKKYFLTTGRVLRKNATRVIQAFAQFKYNHDFELVLLGATDDCPLLPIYKQLIEEYRLGGRVKLISYIESNVELAALYNGAYCFVFPSLYEGFGLPVLESMACETPVITSNISSLPEVGGEAALYVDPQSVVDITAAMVKITQEVNLRASLIERGNAQLKKFSWRKMAVETLEVYKEVVG